MRDLGSLADVCLHDGPVGQGPALFHACALIDWRHGRVFAGARNRREGRPRSGSGAHVRRVHLTPRRPLPLIPHPPPLPPTLRMWPSKGGLRVAHRPRSAVGVNDSPLAWGVGGGGGGRKRQRNRSLLALWRRGRVVSGESLATVARAQQLAFAEARP